MQFNALKLLINTLTNNANESVKIEQTSVYWCFLNLFFKKQISKIVFYFVEQDDLKYIFILKGLNIIAP